MNLYDTGIRPIIEDYIQKKREEKRDYGDYWSASSAGYCMRKQIFERLGVPKTKPDEARLQRVFESGHIFHEWYQKRTAEAGISIAQELELQDENLMVRGHIDDLVLVGELAEVDSDDPYPHSQQHLILYDYKTQHSRSFTFMKDRPLGWYHRLQVGTYLYMIKNARPGQLDGVDLEHKDLKNLSEARLFYISKDDLREMEKQLLWSPELEQQVKTYWDTLNKHWKEKTLPKCSCADQDGGFMAQEKYNPYFYNGEPCSIEWYKKWKAGQ